MFRALLSLVASFALLASLSGCGMIPGTEPDMPAQSFTGTLRSVRPVGGGEPTGWVLEMGPANMGGASLSLDVSKVQDQAKAAEGKQVSVSARQTSGGAFKVESIGVVSR